MTRPIVALDVPTFEDAKALVGRVGSECDFYKVGLELFSGAGPQVVTWLRDNGKQVFVDLKAHDIPNTVAGVARRVAAMGASLFTVHGVGGVAMVRAAVEGAASESASCGILVVTVLTSFEATAYAAAVGRSEIDVPTETLRYAGIAAEAKAHGVVCSGHEAAAIRDRFGAVLRTLVPGVRAPGGSTHDQARVVTPAGAAAAGAAYVILGRAVTAATDPRAAFLEMRSALGESPLQQAP